MIGLLTFTEQILNIKNKGYGTAVVNSAQKCGRIYAVVKNDNFASIRVLEKFGNKKIGFADKHLWSYKLSKSESDLSVFYKNCEESL